MADNPLLHQLRDIHLPQPIGIWPIATGWWIILSLLVMMVFLSFYFHQFLRAYRLKKLYLQELDSIKETYRQQQDTGVALQRLADLLKRFALLTYPRDEVASLHGEAWFNFLKQSVPDLDVTPMHSLLTQSLYQKQVCEDIAQGFVFVEAWIKKQRLSCMN